MTVPAASASYRWLFWLLALTGLTVDQISKYDLFSHLYNNGHGDKIELWPGHFDIAVAPFGPLWPDDGGVLSKLRTYGGCERQPHVNKGALFGIGHGQNLAFGIVSVLAAGFIIGWSFRGAAGRDWFLCIALGLILAGTLGNLYDRIVFEGVRDFLHWHEGALVQGRTGPVYEYVDWPVFNIADVCLVCGAGLLLLEAFFRKADKPASEHVNGSVDAVVVSAANR